MSARECDSCLELRVVVGFRDPDRGAEPSRLDEHGVAERVLDLVAVAQRDVARHRDPMVAEHRLEQVLVHAEGRCCNSGADVGDAGQLEQALDGAVLAERPVQDWDHHVDVRERRRDALRRNGKRLHCRPALALVQLACRAAIERA